METQKPITYNQQLEAELRGSGQLLDTTEYLKADPVTYAREKFKTSGTKYFNEEMWTQAALHGESEALSKYIVENEKIQNNPALDKYNEYAGYTDYDGYMLAMSIPTLDDTEKIEWTDPTTGESFGTFTKKEWATQVLDATFARYDAEKLETEKATRSVIEKVGAGIISAGSHLLKGGIDFAQDIFNIGEGIANVLFNWSQDSNLGDRFLYAFSNDDKQVLEVLSNNIAQATYDFEREYTDIVNAVRDYETGEMYTGWGKYFAGVFDSIGYMLPTILTPASLLSKGVTAVGDKAALAMGKKALSIAKINAITSGVKSGIFYSGIFSSNVKDTITSFGVPYRALNAGEVIANAALKAGAQFAVEKVLGKLIGFSPLDRMMGTAGRATAKTVDKVISGATKTGTEAAKVAARRIGLGVVKEGTEEVLQGFTDGIIDLGTSLIDSTFSGEFQKRGLQQFTIENIVSAFALGALASGLIGGIKNISVVLPKNRLYGEKEGKPYKMGVFETLNYRDALRIMNEWGDIAKDPNSSEQERADAAFKMSVAMDTLGNVIESMSIDNAGKANAALIAQLDVDKKAETAKKLLSSPDYAIKLFDTFTKVNKDIATKYNKTEAIKKATALKKEELSEAKVTQFASIITEKMDSKEGLDIPDFANFQAALKELGITTIIGTDSKKTIVADDIVFTDNNIITTGTIAELIKDLSYTTILAEVKSNLDEKTKRLIVKQYKKITGIDGTLADAITALLFDKRFYTRVLLLTSIKKGDQSQSLKILSTIDKIVRGVTAQQKGRLAKQASTVLMNKIYDTMKTGLVIFATQYVKLDLGEISNEILPIDIKKEINAHRNVLFTEFMNTNMGLNNIPINNKATIDQFNTVIERYRNSDTARDIDTLKQLVKSNKVNEYKQAFIGLSLLIKADISNINELSYVDPKLVYLEADSSSILVRENIAIVEAFFGMSFNDLLNNYDPINLTQEATSYIMANGYDMNFALDKNTCISNKLFEVSNGLFTLAHNGKILQVVDKYDLIREDVLLDLVDTRLNTVLLKYRSGPANKPTRIKDLIKKDVVLPKEIAELEIIPGFAQSHYQDGAKYIGLTDLSTIEALLHEITHATQYFTRDDKVSYQIHGGNPVKMSEWENSIKGSILAYIRDTFPVVWSLFNKSPLKENGYMYLIYFMLSGELQANARFSTPMTDFGFTYNTDKTILFSPDKKQQWIVSTTITEKAAQKASVQKKEVQPGVVSGKAAQKKKAVQPGVVSGKAAQKKKAALEKSLTTMQTNLDYQFPYNEPDILNKIVSKEDLQAYKQFVKYSVLKTIKGLPIIFFRGSDVDIKNDKITETKFSRFYATSPYVSAGYGKVSASIFDIKRENLLLINVSKSHWLDLKFDYALLGTDLIDIRSLLSETFGKYSSRLIPEAISRLEDKYPQEAIVDYEGFPKGAIPLLKGFTRQAISLLLKHKTEDDKVVQEVMNSVYEFANTFNVSETEAMLRLIKNDFQFTGRITTDNLALLSLVKPEIKAVLLVNVDEGIDYIDNDLIILSNDITEKQIGTIPGIEDLPTNKVKQHFTDKSKLNTYLQEATELYNMSENKIYNMYKQQKRQKNKKSKKSKVSDEREISYDISVTEAEKLKSEKQRKYFKERFIPNREAAKSNLKYWIRSRRPIYIDKDVRDFVVATTADFERLGKTTPIYKKILQGVLTKQDIKDYTATASYINDYAFKMIAKYIFHNDELTKLKFSDIRKTIEKLILLDSASFIANATNDPRNNKVMTPEDLYETANNIITENPKYINKAENAATRLKMSGDTITSIEADPKQLNNIFFNNYDGTLKGLHRINNLGKLIVAQQDVDKKVSGSETVLSDVGTKGEAGKSLQSIKTASSYTTKAKYAETIYEANSEILDEIPKLKKIEAVEEYLMNAIQSKLLAMPKEERERLAIPAAKKLREEIDKVHKFDEDTLNKTYLTILAREAGGITKIEDIIATSPKVERPLTRTDLEKQVSKVLNTLLRHVASSKKRYDTLPDNVKQHIDISKRLYAINDTYVNLTDAQLKTLKQEIISARKELVAKLSISKRTQARKIAEVRRIEKLAHKNMKANGKEDIGKKTFKEKVDYKYTTKIVNQTFSFASSNEAPDLVKSLLQTTWSKTKMSTVKGLSGNKEQDVHNGKEFFEQNAEAILKADLNTITNSVKWLLDAKMNNVDDEEYTKYLAIKLYFLGYVLGQTKEDGLYKDMDTNLKNRIETVLKNNATSLGTGLAIVNNIKTLINPIEAMKNYDFEIDGVLLNDIEKEQLFDAAIKGDIDKIKEIELDIFKRVEQERSDKKSIFRKITSVRSMSMLSSPMTWLRNIVSNAALKRLNKWASAIGTKLFKGKVQKGQLTLTKPVTKDIQEFIEKNFLDNKLFDQIISNISKYNPSDISNIYKDATGRASKDTIFIKLIIKSMYNEYYNEHMFDGKMSFLNNVHKTLQKMLSDNNYVREAAIRYFGKIIAEKGYDVSNGKVTDSLMNDFANAIGLGLSDYMHSDNFFNKIENWLDDSTDSAYKEMALFAYKLLLPFASASWNWAKAALRFSPLGLARGIFNMSRLESKIRNTEAAWAKGESMIAPELAEAIARRDLGSGVIGTIAWLFGALLAALGYLDLQEDDYGTPKLRVGNLIVDVSTIFGTSSALAGAAFVAGLNKKGMTLDGLIDGMNNAIDITIGGIPLMNIVEMDMYTDGGFSMGMKQLESIALSFIPNILSWVAGGTYSGNLKKDGFFGKAAAKIPFLGPLFNQKKVDPYTGSEGSWWDAFNRVVPYFSIDTASQNEKQTSDLGLNKSQLSGKYEINNKKFTVSARDLNLINQSYGKWNSIDISRFYQNEISIKVKNDDTNNYVTLTFNQMSDEQRKRAVQTIMSNNAELAKIMAWTDSGHKYYASQNMFELLRKRGVKSNVYKGTKGFVE